MSDTRKELRIDEWYTIDASERDDLSHGFGRCILGERDDAIYAPLTDKCDDIIPITRGYISVCRGIA